MPIWLFPVPPPTSTTVPAAAVEVAQGALDLVTIAIDRLPQQFRDLQTWIDTITVLVEPFQRIENTIADMLALRMLSTATGANLDRIGKIVKERRAGETDDDVYRRRIGARIRQKHSVGTVEDLIAVATLLIFDAAAVVVVEQLGVASVVVRIEGVVVGDALRTLLISFLLGTRSDAVRLVLESAAVAASATFTMAAVAWLTNPHGAGYSGEYTFANGSAPWLPATGTVVIDSGTATEEALAYDSRTTNSINVTTISAFAHSSNSPMVIAPASELGFGDDSNPAVGGAFAIAVD